MREKTYVRLLYRSVCRSLSLAVLAVLLLSLPWLMGCGGGSSPARHTGKGKALFTIKWPQRTGRLVPIAANSIRLTITGTGGFSTSQVTARPEQPPWTTATTFPSLPTGTLTVTATAYPDATGGSGGTVAQAASAGMPLIITDNQTTAQTLTMGSTITSLQVAAVPALRVSGSVVLTVTPLDASGATVLVSPSTLQFTSSASTVATVDSGGKVKGVAAGTATLTVTETESNVSASVSVTVKHAIYIADSGNNRIVQMDDMNGTNFTTYGTLGSGVGQFNLLSSIALDSQGRIYIVDEGNSRIVRIDDMSGTNFTAYGTFGSGNGQFINPWGIALDSQDHIYIADQSNARIVRMDDMSGTNFTAYGTFGSGNGQFISPFSIALDSQDHIYIADVGTNNRIVRIDDISGADFQSYSQSSSFPIIDFIATDTQKRIYDLDGPRGLVVRMDDITGAGFTNSANIGFDSLAGLSVDSAGVIYVADHGNNRIVSLSQISGGTQTNFGTQGSGIGQFNFPTGIFVR